MTRRITLLVLDGDPAVLSLLSETFERDLDVIATANPDSAIQHVRTRRPEIALLGVPGRGPGAMDVLEKIAEIDAGLDVILLSSDHSPQAAVEAVRRGACDYVTKPLDVEALQRRVHQLVSEALKRRETLALDQELLAAYQYQGIVGRSPAILEVFAKIRRISRHFRTVLITGATGTGKELVAKSLHRLSPVAQNRFVSYNCGAIVESLIESELFGHVKGAFTGATQDKVGGFEYADGGVLFLDEVGELPLSAQTRLLRILQNQEVQRVGSPVVRKVDVRVIAATHRDLPAMVEKGRFRDDLYYRLSSLEIRLPTLAERKEDLPLLQRHFIARFSAQYGKSIRGLTRRAQAVLAKSSWPGNIRELENVLSHACIMTDSEVIDVMDLPERFRESRLNDADHTEWVSLDEALHRYATTVLEAVNGDKVEAARILHVSRATLYRILANGNRSTPKHQNGNARFENKDERASFR